MQQLQLQILTDNPRSWIMPFAAELASRLSQVGNVCEHVTSHDDLRAGHVLFLLACERILPASQRALHVHNVVVHESGLPSGRGWAPLTWQLLEGRRVVPICLLDAADPVDSGNVYLRDELVFEGHELCDEIRNIQGRATVSLCERFIATYPPTAAEPQSGTPTHYRRRTPRDSRLDPALSLADQFDLLRVVDNQRYPAWFEYRGHRYRLSIDKLPDSSDATAPDYGHTGNNHAGSSHAE